ncbi:MAG: toxin protein [Myxococcaceae bacterium]|nr:toxin protein [Myxococcaceae bacterium]
MMLGCGDDDRPERGAADGGVDAGRGGGGPSVDAGLDGSTPSPTVDGGIRDKTIFAASSPTGHDRFYGVTYDSAGNIYAVGQSSDSTAAGTDYSFVLAKFTAEGELDRSFGSAGIAKKNVVVGGAAVEAARGVVVQANGKIVVAGNAEHQLFAADAAVGALASDADLFLVRFHPDGSVDNTFGPTGNGIVQTNLGDGVLTQPAPLADGGVPPLALSGGDSVWSLAQTAEGKLVVHSATRGLGNTLDGGLRTDSDFALVRFSADGVLDPAFGGTGIVRTDFNNTNASVRAATVLANGSVVGVGYSSNNVLTGNATTAQNPVLYKLNADGTADATFGTSDPVGAVGVWHDFARSDMKGAEAYGAALQGDKFVTLGYGPTPNTSGAATDLVWFRFNADGSQDKTFGTHGETFQDPGGLGDNGRALVTLGDNRLLGVGAGRPKPAVVSDAGAPAPADGLISVLQENGQPDESFGPGGLRLYDFGGAGDHLWGVALSPNKKQVAAVGIQTGSETGANDNGAVVILTVP